MTWWDDDDLIAPEGWEDPWLAVPVRYSIYGARWDYRKKDWVCICPEYRRRDKCRHTRNFRVTECLDVLEIYL